MRRLGHKIQEAFTLTVVEVYGRLEGRAADEEVRGAVLRKDYRPE